jgi:hypothetical protein
MMGTLGTGGNDVLANGLPLAVFKFSKLDEQI